jgi:hypothetical protein
MKVKKAAKAKKRLKRKAEEPIYGRRPALTLTLIKAILPDIREGCLFENVMEMHGIHESSFYRWCHRGNELFGLEELPVLTKLDKLCMRLVIEIAKARAVPKNESVRQIRQLGAESWTAHKWYLQVSDRRFRTTTLPDDMLDELIETELRLAKSESRAKAPNAATLNRAESPGTTDELAG